MVCYTDHLFLLVYILKYKKCHISRECRWKCYYVKSKSVIAHNAL